MSFDPDTFQLAAPDTLHGLLQRGRGAGYLLALKGPREEVIPILVDCITKDPRWDSQVETRSEYYAALAVAVGLPLTGLERHLEENDDDGQSGWNTPLTITTLGELAKRGYPNAADILRDYFRWGNWWNWALDELVQIGDRKLWKDLHESFCSRFDTDEDLEEELGSINFREEPWLTWKDECYAISRIARGADNWKRVSVQEQESAEYEILPISELVSIADQRNWYKIKKVIVQKVRSSDREFLISQLSTVNQFQSVVILVALASLSDSTSFEAILKFRNTLPKSSPKLLIIQCNRVLEKMPAEFTLRLARAIFNNSQWEDRKLAEGIFKHSATEDDISILHESFEQCFKTPYEECYRICSILESFKRFTENGFHPAIESIFTGFHYSYGRARAAEALYATNPKLFLDQYATECLWDCEESTRKLGIKSVSRKDPLTCKRLEEMANDPFEEDSVRNLARSRITPNEDE